MALGATHTLAAKGALAAIPVLGLLFSTPPVEEPGCDNCVRAEAGKKLDDDNINWGAVIRIRAEMSSPPDIRVIVDTGQSGHFGHRHSYDLNPLWSAGETLTLALDEDVVKEDAEGSVLFYPRRWPPPTRITGSDADITNTPQ